MYIRTSQKGHGIGGLFKGWLKRSIPVIKEKAKTLGKELAVTALDTAYDVGKDILIHKKSPKEAMYDQGKKGFKQIQNNITDSFKKEPNQPKKSIKKKRPSTSVSRIQNAKRKRPRVNNTGFRKITL